MENEVIDSGNASGIVGDQVIKSFLQETAKWAKLMAIVGFIGVGFMAITGLFFGSSMGMTASQIPGGVAIPGALFTVIYLVIAVLYFFPIYYLFNFASKMQLALKTDDQATLRSAFENLKSHYKFIGILLVVFLSLYAIMIVFGLLFAVLVM